MSTHARRSYIHPFLLAAPFWILQAVGAATPGLVRAAPRVVHGIIAGLADYCVIRTAQVSTEWTAPCAIKSRQPCSLPTVPPCTFRNFLSTALPVPYRRPLSCQPILPAQDCWPSTLPTQHRWPSTLPAQHRWPSTIPATIAVSLPRSAGCPRLRRGGWLSPNSLPGSMPTASYAPILAPSKRFFFGPRSSSGTFPCHVCSSGRAPYPTRGRSLAQETLRKGR